MKRCALVLASAVGLACGPASPVPTTVLTPPPPALAVVVAAPPVARAGAAIDLFAGVACAVRRGGDVWCWGSPSWREGPQRPFRVPGIDGAVAVAITVQSVCALLSTGRVACHGHDLRSFDQTVATRILIDRTDVVDIAGHLGLCALARHGAVECFTGPVHREEPRAGPVEGLGGATRLIADNHLGTCAVVSRGAIRCWDPREETPPPEGPSGVEDAVDWASSHDDESCFIRRGGALACRVGDRDGDDDGGGDPDWTPEPAVAPALDVAWGAGFRCVLVQGGDVVCQGLGDHGQLGDGLTEVGKRSTSRLAIGARALAVDRYTACALREDDGVLCWGRNEEGLLGRGQDHLAEVPVRVALPGPARHIAIDAGITCAALDTGVFCWGRTTHDAKSFRTGPSDGPGRLARSRFFEPRRVHPDPTRSVAMGWALAFLGDRSSLRARGRGSGDVEPEAIAVASLDGARSVDFGVDEAVAVTRIGRLVWRDWAGGVSKPFLPVAGIGAVRAVELPYVLLENGDMLRWEAGKASPLKLGIAVDAIASDQGRTFCAVVRGSGEVRCFDDQAPRPDLEVFAAPFRGVRSVAFAWVKLGARICVALGDGTARCNTTNLASERPILEELPSLRGVRQLAIGSSHTCALSEDGSVHCWGSNENDQVGPEPRTFADRPIPVTLGAP